MKLSQMNEKQLRNVINESKRQLNKKKKLKEHDEDFKKKRYEYFTQGAVDGFEDGIENSDHHKRMKMKDFERNEIHGAKVSFYEDGYEVGYEAGENVINNFHQTYI